MKNLKSIYFLLFIVGTIIPTYFFIQFLNEHNLDPNAFINSLLANNPSKNFTSQVFISIIAFWLFMFSESGRKNLMRNILLMLLTFAVGLSSSLPLYLYLRELKKEKNGN
jgi:Terpene cyclase DEP1